MHGTRRSSCRVPGWLAGTGRQVPGGRSGWSPCLPTRALGRARHLPAAHLPWWWWWVHRTVAECVLPLSCPVPGGRADTVAVCGGAVVSSPCACWARSVGRRGVWWWCCRRWRRYDSPILSPDRTTAVLRSPPCAMSQGGADVDAIVGNRYQAKTGGVNPVPWICPSEAK